MPVQLIPLTHGAALIDPARISAAQLTDLLRRGLIAASTPMAGAAGRAGVRILKVEAEPWVWRHYRRGGWPGRYIRDSFLWLGAERTRAFREWRLLYEARALGLPVPVPVAATYRRSGLRYQCDLVTVLIPTATSLGARLQAGPVDLPSWQRVGDCIRRFHDRGICHADLNVHNILFDAQGQVFLIDFDRGDFRVPGSWRDANWARLRRSLEKVARTLPADRFGDAEWRAMRRESNAADALQ